MQPAWRMRPPRYGGAWYGVPPAVAPAARCVVQHSCVSYALHADEATAVCGRMVWGARREVEHRWVCGLLHVRRAWVALRVLCLGGKLSSLARLVCLFGVQ